MNYDKLVAYILIALKLAKGEEVAPIANKVIFMYYGIGDFSLVSVCIN